MYLRCELITRKRILLLLFSRRFAKPPSKYVLALPARPKLFIFLFNDLISFYTCLHERFTRLCYAVQCNRENIFLIQFFEQKQRWILGARFSSHYQIDSPDLNRKSYLGCEGLPWWLFVYRRRTLPIALLTSKNDFYTILLQIKSNKKNQKAKTAKKRYV